jgi:hypothetical protein
VSPPVFYAVCFDELGGISFLRHRPDERGAGRAEVRQKTAILWQKTGFLREKFQ